MFLADLIESETRVARQHIMFLRHSIVETNAIRQYGGSLEEYTAVQPIGSKYDFTRFRRPQIHVVVVIVDDTVHAVYEILGFEEGTNYSLASSPLWQRNIDIGYPEKPARRFKLRSMATASLDRPIKGWKGRTRTPVQTADGGFFNEITVDVESNTLEENMFSDEFLRAVAESLSSDDVI